MSSPLHIVVPASSSQKPSASPPATPPRFSQIRHVEIQDSVVEFSSPEPEGTPLQVAVKEVVFDGVTRTSPASFRAELLTNEPQGTVRAAGQIGPWHWEEAGQTPLSGSFTFRQADLSTVGRLEGSLNAQGQFAGPLGHVVCRGRIQVPQFGTTSGNHALPLTVTFHATVNGRNGDTTLDQVEARLNRTVVHSQGTIQGEGQRAGKTAHLRLWVDDGQIDDLLLLFTRCVQPAMTGTIRLQAEATVPPGPPDFLRKLELQGDFGLSGSRFTKASTQAPINHLSESAAGLSKKEQEGDPRTVLSDVKGHVSAQKGIATLSQVSFTVPGAQARMAGTYNLLDKDVRLQGTLRTTGHLPDATSGLKAGLLKVISPFLKQHSVTVVPFQITGTAAHSTFALNLARKQQY